MKNMINNGKQIKINQYKLSLDYQSYLTKKFEKVIKNFDFLITPSTGSTAPKIGNIEKMDTSLIWTFLAHQRFLSLYFLIKKLVFLLVSKL